MIALVSDVNIGHSHPSHAANCDPKCACRKIILNALDQIKDFKEYDYTEEVLQSASLTVS